MKHDLTNLSESQRRNLHPFLRASTRREIDERITRMTWKKNEARPQDRKVELPREQKEMALL